MKLNEDLQKNITAKPDAKKEPTQTTPPVEKKESTLNQYFGGGTAEGTAGEIRLIEYDKIVPNPKNKYSMTGIEDLKLNIAEIGLIEPLTVVEVNFGEYEIQSGHRRWTALGEMLKEGTIAELIRQKKWKYPEGMIPCIVREEEKFEDEINRDVMLLGANMQRKKTDDDVLFEIEMVKDIIIKKKAAGETSFNAFGKTYEIEKGAPTNKIVGEVLGKSESWVTKTEKAAKDKVEQKPMETPILYIPKQMEQWSVSKERFLTLINQVANEKEFDKKAVDKVVKSLETLVKSGN